MKEMVETTIGELGRYINGRGFKPAEWGKTGLPIVRIANLNNPCAPYDFYEGAIDPGHCIDSGDIVVSWSATLDAFRWNRGVAALNQHSFKVIPNGAVVDVDYLFYVLKVAMGGLSELVHGATMKHVTRPEFENFKVRIHPDKETQDQIARQLQAQLGEIESSLQGAQKQLQEIPLLRSRLLSQIFAGVETAPLKVLGDYAPTTSGTTPSRGNKAYWSPAEVPWVKTGEVAFAHLTATEEAVSRLALKECSLSLLPPKTVLVAMIGQGKTRGQSALLEIEATTNQNCFAVLPSETWQPEFLYYWFVANYQNLRNLSSDRGGSQSALNGALLKALEVPAPDHDTQARVVGRVQAALAEVGTMQAASRQMLKDLEQLPQRILARAFEN